jgi:hydrogenase maturation protein HypF
VDALFRARRLTVAGQVQGVGFRPFVYRLATRHHLSGWVQNRSGQVEILVQGTSAALDAFARGLLEQAPPLAKPHIARARPVAPVAAAGFSISASNANAECDVHLPPDYFTCDECLAELADPRNRRYRYPFINCTQCGPRYTLIRRLPYDRANTTMAGFAMCPDCRREYEDPLDRRFHAEPTACPACGPRLRFNGDAAVVAGNEPALEAATAALRAGKIVAVKGVGGYHLMCDATDDDAVQWLRERKPRPHKPLAVMFPRDDAVLERHLALDALHRRLLLDPTRAIVLVQRVPGTDLSPRIAPGLREVGVMLAYSPLHHLLLAAVGRPLVATSANISGEPVLTTEGDVERRLGHVCHGFLHHDRPIERPADDPVLRVVAGKPRRMRLGRGCAPLELALPFALAQPTLAVGAQMKNAIALAWDRRVVVSAHIGELDSPRSTATFEQSVEDLQALYGVRATVVACDANPGFFSTRWAHRSGLALRKVWHHHAHASALAGEYPGSTDWLVFTWDGVGLGEDASLWGGDALLGAPGRWRRVARMRPFRPPGGDKAAREPWRSAAALCWEAQRAWHGLPAQAALAREAWRKGINSPQTTAVGRLFDAAAALTGINLYASFEGQAPMMLEAAAAAGSRPSPLPLPVAEREGFIESNWAPLLPAMLDTQRSVAERAALWHESLAAALVAQAHAVRSRAPFDRIGLAGGVFQNRLLTERVIVLLEQDGFDVRLPERLPCNDAAIAYGQIVEAAPRG